MLTVAVSALIGCAKLGNSLNPFAEDLPPQAFGGEPNDHALRAGGEKIEKARESLQSVGRYPRAHQPQPQNPVIQPSVVRLMWVPDHLNTSGDLVPAHFYYLKVLDDRWAATDVFDQRQLINESSGARSSSIPFVTK